MKNISKIAMLVVVAFTSSCGVASVNNSGEVKYYTHNSNSINVSSVKSNASISFNISANSFKTKVTSSSTNPPKTVANISYYEVYLLKNSNAMYPPAGDPVSDIVVGGGTAFQVVKQSGATQLVTFKNIPPSGTGYYYYVGVRAYDLNGNEIVKANTNWTGSSVAPNNRIAVSSGSGISVSNNYTVSDATDLSVGVNLEDGIGARIDANLYLQPNLNTVATRYPSKTLDIIAGNATGVAPTTNNQMATNAKLTLPANVTVDGLGNVYISENSGNNTIDRIDTNGQLKIVAGGGASVPDTSGTQNATAVSLVNPFATAIDNLGNLYIADRGHNTIEKVDVSGKITVIAGSGVGAVTATPTAATTLKLNDPTSVAVDNFGNIYITEFYGGASSGFVEKLTTDGKLSIIAGNGASVPSTSGNQNALTDIKFSSPTQIALDSSGNIYVNDYGLGMVEKITVSTGKIQLIAGGGTGTINTPTTAASVATNANLVHINSLALDTTGNIYVADYNNSFIEKIDLSTGMIKVVAGGGASTPVITNPKLATDVKLNGPTGVAVDSAGALYIADYTNNYVEIVTP